MDEQQDDKQKINIPADKMLDYLKKKCHALGDQLDMITVAYEDLLEQNALLVNQLPGASTTLDAVQ